MTGLADGVDLLRLSPAAGCACKVPMDRLRMLLSSLENLVEDRAGDISSTRVGLPARDDAAVYEIGTNLSLIYSVDFGTPVTADPFRWGRIAAMNAISDIYAMGGSPFTALSILGWPTDLTTDPITKVMEGAVSTLRECPASLAGGHTIVSDVPLFGLCVLGSATPGALILNSNARPGHRLILTKPLGTGIIVAAQKAGLASCEAIQSAETLMMTSNKAAARLGNELGINAGTDITGYGFAGHLVSVLDSSGVSAELDYTRIPFTHQAVDILNTHGIVPNGAERNYFDLQDQIDWTNTPLDIRFILCDPQTSGGLLLAAPERRAQEFLVRAKRMDIAAVDVGIVTERNTEVVRIGRPPQWPVAAHRD